MLGITQALAITTYSQSTRLSFELNDSPVKNVLNKIEDVSEFFFIYDASVIDVERRVSINIDEKLIPEILDEVFDGTNVVYKVDDRQIALTKSNANINNAKVTQQQKSVTGTVESETGDPLPGVTVLVKGTTNGVITDFDGNFTLNNVTSSDILVFTFIGMRSQEVEVGDKVRFDISMAEETIGLEEIVATGYATERKKDIIGSVAIVDTDEMVSQPSGNVTSQLVGRVSGVTIASDGSVNGSSKVRVRGFGSFNSSEPLYIIDGVPGDIDNINPNDIESMQILKDAASASVYGARAANGVVVITTKRGKEGSLTIDVDSYTGINFVGSGNFPDLLDAQEWGDLYFSEMRGAGLSPGDEGWGHPQYGSGAEAVIPEYILANVNGSRTGGAELAALKVSDPASYDSYVNPDNYDLKTHQIVKSGNTNWFDEVFNPASVTSMNVSATGGSEKGNFALGVSYFDQNSTSNEYEYFKRYTLRANTSFNLNDVVTLGENLQVTHTKGRNGSGSITGAAWTMPSLLPVYDIAGNYASSAARGICDTADGGLGNNPLSSAYDSRFDGYYTYGIFGNAYIDIKPIDNLVIHSSIGANYNANTSKNYTPVTYIHSENTAPPNTLNSSWRNNNTWTWTNTINYSKTFGDHVFKLLLGSESIDQRSENVSATRADIAFEDDWFLVIGAGTGTQTNGGTYSVYKLFSYFGRFDYTYADKYIFNATLRRDGSSKFGANNKFGYFPAAALGWRISGEDFMNDIDWITDLKLRTSYGVIGNQSGLSNENQFSTFEGDINEGYPINGSSSSYANSYVKSRLGNLNARWEKTITSNIGLDATLFDGGLTLNAEYFIKETEDLLVTNQAPYTAANVTQPSVNAGNIKNTGFELSVNKRGNINRDLTYDVGMNFTTYKNEVVKVLDNPDAVLYGGNTRLGNVAITRKGSPISTFYGYITDGFYNSQAEVDEYVASYNNTWLAPAVGRWKIKDVSGPDGTPDHVINDYDRTDIGNPHPDFQMSFNINLAYKGFDFNAMIFWNQGGDIFNYTRYNIDFNTYAHNRSARMLYDSWTPDNTNALLPKHDINDTFSNTYATDYYVEDATYIRLMTMQLGYTFPQTISRKIGLNSLRLYAQGQNLFTWKKEFTGMDPGVSTSGDSDLGMGVVNSYAPTPQQIIFGVNLKF